MAPEVPPHGNRAAELVHGAARMSDGCLQHLARPRAVGRRLDQLAEAAGVDTEGVDADLASHQFHELFGNCKSQSGTSVPPARRTVGLAELLKD